MTLTVEQIVAAGLCIGCGLCRAIAGPERLEIAMTPEGRGCVKSTLSVDSIAGT